MANTNATTALQTPPPAPVDEAAGFTPTTGILLAITLGLITWIYIRKRNQARKAREEAARELAERAAQAAREAASEKDEEQEHPSA